MQAVFEFLKANPYILLFVTIGLAVWVGKFTIKGYGLGMVAAAIVVGAGLSTAASLYGVKLSLDNFTRLLFYYLFMYGVGLRVGPSFINSLKGDGAKFSILAVLCSGLGLALVVVTARLFGLPAGAAGGILAGSQTMSAAIGTADLAVSSGAYTLPPGTTADQVSGMIALSYGITYIWGTVGIILICKYLPRWWGLDARRAAQDYERQFGVPNVDDTGLTGYRPFGIRAYQVASPAAVGKTIGALRDSHPEYRYLRVQRGEQRLEAADDLVLRERDVVALGGSLENLTSKMGIIGPEVPSKEALSIPLDVAEILVTNREAEKLTLEEYRKDYGGQVQAVKIERAGNPIPLGSLSKLQRFDVITVAGLAPAVKRLADFLGKVARPSTATDLLTLAVGMILGFLIGMINVPVGSFSVGLGNAGGLLLSGIAVSSLVSRVRFFGNTPNAARNILEDLGLITFICIVGINAGATLLEQLTGSIAVGIFVAGFIASTIPPFVTWAVGYHIFKINPAVLMGGVAGARSHSGPAREAAKEIDSTVPWIGFPVGYAVSGVLLTVFGYFAMIL
jgi:putative transport protein